MESNNIELLKLISEILEYTEDPTPTSTPETPTPSTPCNCDTLGCGGDVSGCPDGPWDLEICTCSDGTTLGCPKCAQPTPSPTCGCTEGVPCSSCSENQICTNGSLGFCSDGSVITCGTCTDVTPTETSTSTETPTETPTETKSRCPCNCNTINFSSLSACENWLPPGSSYKCSNASCSGADCETNTDCATANTDTPTPSSSPTPSRTCPKCDDYFYTCNSAFDCLSQISGYVCVKCQTAQPFQVTCSDGSTITLTCNACGGCESSCGVGCFSSPAACEEYADQIGGGYCSSSSATNLCCDPNGGFVEPCSCWFSGTPTMTSTNTPTPTDTCLCEDSSAPDCYTSCSDCEKFFPDGCTSGIPNPSCPGSGKTCCCGSPVTPSPTSTPTSTPTISCCPPDCCKNPNICASACGGNSCCSCSSSSQDVPDPCNGSCAKTTCYSATLIGRNLYRATCCVRLPGQVNPTFYQCCTAGERASNCNGYRPGVPSSESYSC